jgi:hypothetical protein
VEGGNGERLGWNGRVDGDKRIGEVLRRQATLSEPVAEVDGRQDIRRRHPPAFTVDLDTRSVYPLVQMSSECVECGDP